jgi:hypothetical protein
MKISMNMILLIIVFLSGCGGSMNQEDYEKDFVAYKGTKDGYAVIGSYLPKPPSPEVKKTHATLFTVVLHLKEPQMELEKGDTGLPTDEVKKNALVRRNEIIALLKKHGTPLLVANYFWFNQFDLYFYVKEDESNAMWNEMNTILEETKYGFTIAMSTTIDKDWDYMKQFEKPVMQF